MNSIPMRAENQITQLVTAAVARAVSAGALPAAELLPFKVEIPADRKNGDYSTNIAEIDFADLLKELTPCSRLAERATIPFRIQDWKR